MGVVVSEIDHGDHNRGRKGDGELAEEAADDAAHHQDGNEDGDQRHADGKNGEADFPRALEGGLEGRHAAFQMAGDVLHDHDGVVHHEAGGDGERHEREVVEAVAEQIHYGEGADQRHRHGDAGNERGARAAQEDEDHQHHQDDGAEQGLFDVVHRGADGGGAIEHDGDVDALGEHRLRNGSCALMRSTVWMMLAPGWRKMMMNTACLPSM